MASSIIACNAWLDSTPKGYTHSGRLAFAGMTAVGALAGMICVTTPAQAICTKGQLITDVKSLASRQSSETSGDPRSFTLSEGVAFVIAVGKRRDSNIELTIPGKTTALCQSSSQTSGYRDGNVTTCRADVQRHEMNPGEREHEFKVIVKNNDPNNALDYNLICLNGQDDFLKLFIKKQ